jgi:hypothetical protein
MTRGVPEAAGYRVHRPGGTPGMAGTAGLRDGAFRQPVLAVVMNRVCGRRPVRPAIGREGAVASRGEFSSSSALTVYLTWGS